MKYDAAEFLEAASIWIDGKPEEQLINEERLALRLRVAVNEAERLRIGYNALGGDACIEGIRRGLEEIERGEYVELEPSWRSMLPYTFDRRSRYRRALFHE